MRRAVLAAALAVVLPAAAQDAVLSAPPPLDAAGPPAQPGAGPPAPAVLPEAAAPPAPGLWKAWELSVLGWGGAYSGGAAERGAGGFDATIVFRGDLLAVGARAGSAWLGSALGSSLAAVGGVMLPLSARIRLDLLGDAGLGLYLIPQEGDGAGCGPGTFCDGRAGATVIRPELGARAGFAFLTADGRLSFVVGAFARVVPEERVGLERRTCVFSSCATTTESRTVGGRAFGAYLGLGFPRR